MKKLTKIAFCMAFIAMVMVSCSNASGNGIVGKWKQVLNESGVKIEATYDFKADGTMTQEMEMKSDNPKMDVEAEGKATYTYTDNTITFKFSGENVTIEKFEMEGVPQEMIDMAIEQQKQQMTNMTQVLSDVKINGNTMTANFNGQQITLEKCN